jgi:hypothetical protein
MKVVTKEVIPVFEPVSLVLETQAEVDLFKAFLGAIRGSDVEEFGVNRRLASATYDALKGTPTRRQFTTMTLKSE